MIENGFEEDALPDLTETNVFSKFGHTATQGSEASEAVVNGITIPAHLLERARKAREKIAAGTDSPIESGDGDNTLLSFGLSENFNDCSIAAATANQNVYVQVECSGATKDLIFAAEDGCHLEMQTKQVSEEIVLPSSRKVKFAVVRAIQDSEAPPYLLAITHNNIALRLASFGRREDDVICDYVQIGEEMESDDFVVTPEDEQSSRLEIVNTIRDLTESSPVDLTKRPGTANLYPGSTWLAIGAVTTVTAILEELTRLKIIDDSQLLSTWQSDRAHNEWFAFHHAAKIEKCHQKAKEFVQNELKGRPEYIADVKTPVDFQYEIRKVVESFMIRKNDPSSAQKLADLLRIDQQLEKLLGKTTPEVEELLDDSNLPAVARIKQVEGIRRGVRVGGTKASSNFRIIVSEIDKIGYNVTVLARPEAMPEREFKVMHELVYYIDREQNPDALQSARDVLDLIAHATQTK